MQTGVTKVAYFHHKPSDTYEVCLRAYFHETEGLNELGSWIT